jgi:hypothetical protein
VEAAAERLSTSPRFIRRLTGRSRTRSTHMSRPSKRGAATMRTVRPTSWSLLANGPLMARTVHDDPRLVRSGLAEGSLTCGYAVERVTRIEPALSAWESVPSRALTCPELRSRLSASDREIPVFTGVNGTLMARRSWPEPSRWSYRPSAFQAGHIPSWHKSSERYALWPVAAGCHRSLLLLSPLLSPAMRPRLVLQP